MSAGMPYYSAHYLLLHRDPRRSSLLPACVSTPFCCSMRHVPVNGW